MKQNKPSEPARYQLFTGDRQIINALAFHIGYMSRRAVEYKRHANRKPDSELRQADATNARLVVLDLATPFRVCRPPEWARPYFRKGWLAYNDQWMKS